ncbi:MAG: siroheme synthase CysG [Hyphomonas oceanitis]|uniref:siroheme synthase CysG n=1 Tax=Hyphomonas oceanitis TaxID=81033 RepID=UPI00300198E9
MRQFPAFFNLDNASVVVFGGGEEARRKVRLLAATPARITVIVSKIDPGFAEEFAGRVTIAPPEHAGPALDVARFAIVANRLDANAEKAITMARQYGVPLNVVDHPELCDFTVPSIIDRGDVVAAIGTNGSAPVLAKAIREKLEALLPKRIGDLAALASRLRPDVKAAIPDSKARRRFWETALTGPTADLAYAGDLEGAEAAMRAQLASGIAAEGIVHIVGAGPGDPELMTLKALRLIQEADVVYYDRLVSDEILSLIRRDADRVPVGKSKGDHSVPQETIHELLIASAQEGKRVVRLKGGDPFIFGRGGEELEAVRAAGVAATVVPGISSALGCAAAAGLPLTHRDHAQSLTFVTGHARAGGVPDLDWASLARPAQTVVVFMGVGTSATIAEKIIAAGRAPSTPVAVIENGTRDNEIRVFGTLAELPHLIQRAGIKGPALLVIGEVAGLPAEAITQAFKEHVA